jgi:hypothetical protein
VTTNKQKNLLTGYSLEFGLWPHTTPSPQNKQTNYGRTKLKISYPKQHHTCRPGVSPGSRIHRPIALSSTTFDVIFMFFKLIKTQVVLNIWCLPRSYRIFVITGAQWSGGGKCTFLFENDLFDPGIGYFTPQISLKKCFFRLSRTQWSIFTIHSDPLGGNSQKWVSTVVRWAETAKKLAP